MNPIYRKRNIFFFAALVLLLITLFANRSIISVGRAANTQILYFPLVYNPPEPPEWIGPYGGFVVGLAVAPSQPTTLYAGTWGSGIYKSSDAGATWVWKSTGLGYSQINSMVIDPYNAQVAYAGTYTGKVYKTVDGGEHWFQSSTGIQESAIVYSMVIDPTDNENIFIGTRGVSNNGGPPWNGVLYRSTDAGNTWEPKLTNVGGKSQEDWAYAVTLHPKYPNQIYAATHEHGVYRSWDSGKNWQAVNNGLTNLSTRGIVVNPSSGETHPVLYTGVWTWDGAFRSNDGGDSWFQRDASSTNTRLYSLAINPKDTFIVYASTFSGGVLKTADGGNTWSIVGLKDYEIPITAIDPQTPQILYAGTNGQGLYKSFNAGANWQRSQQGLHATRVSALQIWPDNAQRLYASLKGDSVQQSGDGGQTWSLLGTNLGDRYVLGLVMRPDQPRVMFALTETAGLYRCDLEGTCWQKISINFPAITQTAFEPGHPFAVPPLLDEVDAEPQAVTATPALLALRFAPSAPQTGYLGTAGAGIYKTLDGGGTWFAAGLSGSRIVNVAVNAGNANQVFAASDTKIWRSDNGGANWADTGLSGLNIFALAWDGAGNLYAGTSNGIYLYTLTGWVHLGLAGVSVTALVAHPTNPGVIYAGTLNGLQITRNAGATWNRGPLELNGLTISALNFDPADASQIFISTTTQGVLHMYDWK